MSAALCCRPMAEIFGVGIDAVAIDRMESGAIAEHAVERLFHPSEVEQARSLDGKKRAEFLASRFAAKEAYAKALGTGFRDVVPAEIAVAVDSMGKPSLLLSGKSRIRFDKEHLTIHLSLTHEGPLAIALVIIERRGDEHG